MLLYKITVASGLVLRVVISLLNFSWRLGGMEVGHIIRIS